MRVIINADDLGAREAVNDAIFDTMSRKCVSSATLLANGPCFEQAVQQLASFPNCSFGVHLNITEFRPLSFDGGLGTILDEDGFFRGNIEEVRKTPFLLLAIIKEFCAQIERLLSFGVKISHIDSHHHVHTLSHIFPILKYLQNRYRLKRVRISYNIYKPSERPSRNLLLKKSIYNIALKHCYKTQTTAGFTDLVAFFETVKLNEIQHPSVEIMVHPGSTMNEAEDQLLSSVGREGLPVKVNLINYNEL